MMYRLQINPSNGSQNGLKNCGKNLLYFNRGINVTLKPPRVIPTASKVVDGYTEDMLARLHNGMPQRGFTEVKNKYVERPKSMFMRASDPIYKNFGEDNVPTFQVEFKD